MNIEQWKPRQYNSDAEVVAGAYAPVTIEEIAYRCGAHAHGVRNGLYGTTFWRDVTAIDTIWYRVCQYARTRGATDKLDRVVIGDMILAGRYDDLERFLLSL